MFLSLREMEVRKIWFDTSYAPAEIDFSDVKLRQAVPLQVRGVAELMGATEEIRVKGHIQVRMEAECDRCLETASLAVDSDFDLFYRPEKQAVLQEEAELDEGESQMGFYRGEGLELAEVVREQVLLALPMQRICRTDCKGICPVCGRNRNLADCSCQARPVDDRWAALRDL